MIGGKMIYETYWQRAQRLYITRIHEKHLGDIYFPEIPFDNYQLIESTKQGVLTFEVYERVIV